MTFRLKERKGKYKAQVKTSFWMGWRDLDRWWGNYKKVTDGVKEWFMLTDYRIIVNNGQNYTNKEYAEALISDAKKQPKLYTISQLGVSPNFKDCFSFYPQL